jgi:hypothetical protein
MDATQFVYFGNIFWIPLNILFIPSLAVISDANLACSTVFRCKFVQRCITETGSDGRVRLLVCVLRCVRDQSKGLRKFRGEGSAPEGNDICKVRTAAQS